MEEIKYIIIIHQIIFQGMFIAKNILLKKKIKKNIRGKNKEAIISTTIFSIFITISIASSISDQINDFFITIPLLSNTIFKIIGIILLLINLFLSMISLYEMKDSWRVGVIENEKTELVTSGIFKYSRNPYFLSYLLMFISYTFILTNVVLIVLTMISFQSVHSMILKEEKNLSKIHGECYQEYKKKTGRYFFV